MLPFSCKKKPVSIDKVIESLKITPQQIDADGTSIAVIEVEINPKADATKRTVIFSATSGNFENGTNSTISEKAKFENNKLIARVRYKATSKSGSVIITAKMDLPEQPTDYQKSDSLRLNDSKPDTIFLKASALGVMINFGNEITITGVLQNIKRKNVSAEKTVEIDDYYENGLPVNGSFREKQLTTTNNSTISFIYSPGFVQVNKKIWLKATLINEDGSPSKIKDSILIHTIQN